MGLYRLMSTTPVELTSAADYVSAAAVQGGNLWVFAYGSLMWQTPPGLQVVRKVRATLAGYERSFCVHSRNYRGTPESPGLVLGLQPAESFCEGVAVLLGDATGSCESALSALALIDAQEMIAQDNPVPVYIRTLAPVTLHSDDEIPGDVKVLALAYVANTAAGANAPAELSLRQRADIITRSMGSRGPNQEYLNQTAARLDGLGIQDAHVRELAERVANLR
jgi:glutathione-specific gamma-glutamylcyclotransferase